LDVEANGKITVSTTITNTGDRAGREVVQLYVSKPNSKAKSLEGFAKTPLQQPGQSALITIELNQRSFAHWSTETGGWVIASGEYRLDVARSVSDTIAELSYSVEENKFL
jgi:beta-glucosidase